MKYIATKEFSIGIGGAMTAYGIGDVVSPAHAIIAPTFCAPEGKAPKDEPEPEPEPEPEQAAEEQPKPKKAAKKAKKNGKKD